MVRYVLFILSLLVLMQQGYAQVPGKWGDQHDGTYANTILPGDFQNTDVIRVGENYYYISATKQLSPGMMVMTSKDLVNWRIIGHAVADLTQISPRYNYDRMEGPSRGVWAGAIAYHQQQFYVYFTDPDFGIFMTTASNPAGPWAPLVPVLQAAGWDDPCPLWDNDGKAWLVATNFSDHYKIHLFGMSWDGTRLLPNEDIVIHQSKGSEANKIYKINNYYYHFYSEVTSEGRMPFMERSTNIKGPYLDKKQLIHRAEAEPNQGGMVQTEKGDWWFVTHHGTSFWDGREASLLPVQWVDGWPVWGKAGPDGVGNMLWSAAKPIAHPVNDSLKTSDQFDSSMLSPQWEWHFEPRNDKWSLKERPGYLRLYACQSKEPGNIARSVNVLTQRTLRIPKSTITAKLDIGNMSHGQTAALGIFGLHAAEVGIVQKPSGKYFYYTKNGRRNAALESKTNATVVWLRSEWDLKGRAHFSYSNDGIDFKGIGKTFQITNFGNYLGARIGLFTTNNAVEEGFVDIDWFQYEKG